MTIAAFGNETSRTELTQQDASVEWIWVNDLQQLFAAGADAYFNLSEDEAPANTSGKPFFINSVVTTLQEMNAKENTIRINGWNGFLIKDTWEVSGTISEAATKIFAALNKKIIEVADEPGFISARVIAMVINEAFYAEAEAVSTPNEIDVAMKLGTNYPFGPFEWSEKIGLKNIYNLLKKLSEKDSRYTPAPSLVKKIDG
jgi:3-hydroxybutyryl-CoA dehydrogenase